MKELGKIIAKNRKANKMKQGELAKKLESYDIFVKQNTVSAWESGSTQPSARQLLAICELLDIYDVYTEFIGQNPINPFRNLNEEGINKVMDYIRLLEKSGDYKLAEIIPIHVIRERKVFYTTVSARVPVPSWMEKIMKCTPLPTSQRKQPLECISVVTVWNLATTMRILSGSNRPNSLTMEKSASSTWMEMLISRNSRITEKEPILFLSIRNTIRFPSQKIVPLRFLAVYCLSPFYCNPALVACT